MLGCNPDLGKTVLETVGAVVGTGKGVVIEYFGGKNNGKTCPSANLELQEDWESWGTSRSSSGSWCCLVFIITG